jgi:hypothetical protein
MLWDRWESFPVLNCRENSRHTAVRDLTVDDWTGLQKQKKSQEYRGPYS